MFIIDLWLVIGETKKFSLGRIPSISVLETSIELDWRRFVSQLWYRVQNISRLDPTIRARNQPIYIHRIIWIRIAYAGHYPKPIATGINHIRKPVSSIIKRVSLKIGRSEWMRMGLI